MRRAALLCALALCFSAPLLAQEAPISPSPVQATQPEGTPLPSLLETSQLLKARLETRKQQAQTQVESWTNIVSQLQNENENDKKQSTELSDKLAKAEAALAKSQADLTAISNSLDALSTDFASYKKQAENKISALSAEVRTYKTAGKILLAVATLAGGYFGGHALCAW